MMACLHLHISCLARPGARCYKAGGELIKELGGKKANLVVNNYSDGNLVATLLETHSSALAR